VRGLLLDDVRFSDEPAGFSVRARQIRATAGLLAVLRSRGEFGTLEVSALDVLLVPPGERAAAPAAPGEQTPREGKPAAGPESRRAGAGATPWAPRGTLRVSDGRIEIRPAGPRPPFVLERVTADAALQGLDQPVSFNITASGALRASGAYEPRTGSGRLSVDLADIPLAALAAAARQFAGARDAPDADGRLTASLTARMEGRGDIQAAGSVRLRDLALRGGALGEDAPAFEAVELDFDLGRRGNGFSVKKLRLESPVLRASASGDLAPAGAGRYPTGALAASAEMDLAAVAARFPRALGISEGTTVSSGAVALEARVDSAPQRLGFSGRLETRGVAAVREGRRVALDTPLRLAVSGAVGENGPAVQELSVTSSFARVEGAGTLTEAWISADADVAAALREAGKFVDLGKFAASGTVTASARMESAAGGEKRVEARVSARDLAVSGATPRPLRLDSVEAAAAADVGLSGGRRLRYLGGVTGSLKCAALSARASAARVVPEGGGLPAVKGGKLAAEGSLGDLLDLAQTVMNTNFGFSARGSLGMDSAVEIRRGQVSFPALSASVSGFSLEKEGRRFAEEKAALDAAGVADLAGGSVALDSVRIASGLLNFAGTGSARDLRGARTLALDGTVECDFARADALLLALCGRRFELAGKQSRPLRLRMPLAGGALKDFIAATEADAELPLDRARVFGVEVASAVPRLRVKDAVARLEADAAVNEGRLSVAPFLDARGGTPFVAVPDRSQVLADVRVTQAMTSELLAMIHPVFRGCGALGGRLSLALDRCRVPVEEGYRQKMDIGGRLALRGLQLAPGGTLAGILEVARVRDPAVRAPDQDVTFSCRDGRIEATPLTLTAGANTMVISGSMGVDGTLDYVAEIPVTEGMVGSELYGRLKDARLKLEIKGTASQPRIARGSFDGALGELVRQAARSALTNQVSPGVLLEQGGKAIDKFLKDRKLRF
jgi:hypothetical protein